MLALIAKHSFLTICVAVLLEELGIPMPIPTDILIVFAGVEGAGSVPRLALWFAVLNLMSAIGASGLYFIVRRGGRPLVERFGRYVHLGPEQLARSEEKLKRTGWLGIAVGRSIPGLRYVTVIACGLLNVPYGRFLSAHIVGSSVYIAVFLALGAIFGRTVVERIHAPELLLRLLWLLLLAVGLPALLIWLSYRGHATHPAPPSRWRVLSALIVASFAGATSLAATWATASTLTQFFGLQTRVDIARGLANWLFGRGVQLAGAYTLIYTVLLLLCVAVGVAYFDLILPFLAPNTTSLPRQFGGLAVLVAGLIACFLVPSLYFQVSGPLAIWWTNGGTMLLFSVALGIISYSLTTVYGRALAIAVLPSLRRKPTRAAPPGTPPSEMVGAEEAVLERVPSLDIPPATREPMAQE